jgi:ribosomal protein S18 acetylase RimI-like enzyme
MRAMRLSDLPAVNRVLSKSFTSARLEEGYKNAFVPACHLSFLEMYLSSLPNGCFVMEHKNNLVGYSFARLWGKVGWIGPVSLLPAHQGKKLGREIMRATIRALQETGAKVIGLETAPRNYRNLGFYSKLGFKAGRLTLDVIKRVPPVAQEALPSNFDVRFYSQADPAERMHLVSAAETLARANDPHLSLGEEIERIDRFKYGDTMFVFEHNRLLACALGHTETYFDEEPARYLKILLMLLKSGGYELAGQVVAMLCSWASQKSLDTVCIRAPLRYFRSYRQLLALGFRVFHAELRMTLKGHHEAADPRNFYLSKWE